MDVRENSTAGRQDAQPEQVVTRDTPAGPWE
jgi:hypothetical protein